MFVLCLCESIELISLSEKHRNGPRSHSFERYIPLSLFGYKGVIGKLMMYLRAFENDLYKKIGPFTLQVVRIYNVQIEAEVIGKTYDTYISKPIE